MKRLKDLTLIIAAFIPIAFADESPKQIVFTDSSGYHYAYKKVELVDGFAGIVETRDRTEKFLMYRATALPPPGCPGGEFQTAKTFSVNTRPRAKEVTALCGSDQGHRQTLYLFEHGLPVASLQYDLTYPNLTWNSEAQSFFAEVYFRVPDESGSLTTLLVVYEWSPNNVIHNGFQAAFNDYSRQKYWAYYETQKRNAGQEVIPFNSIIASLISTSDATKICTELKSYPVNTLSESKIREMIKFNQQYGIPSFNPSICGGGN